MDLRCFWSESRRSYCREYHGCASQDGSQRKYCPISPLSRVCC